MFVAVGLCCALFLLSVINSSEVSDGGTYYLSEDVGPWTEPNCTLATPAFTINERGAFILAEDPELLNVLANETDEIWVGYFNAYQNFQYIGCIKMSKIPNGSMKIRTKNDPGLCHSYCQTSYLGIIKKQLTVDGPNCFCLTSIDMPILEDHCDETCSNGLLCGGRHYREKYLSLYEIEENSLAPDSPSEDNCCFRNNEGSLSWGICNEDYETVCKTSDNNLEIIDSWFSLFLRNTWKDAMQECLCEDLNPLPASASVIKKVEKDNLQVWTAMVRRKAVFNISVMDKKPFSSGYIKRSNDRFDLLFGEEETKELKSLCVKDKRLTTTPTKARPSTETEPTNSFESTSDVTSTITEKPSKMLNVPAEQVGSGVYVGVSIGVILGLGILGAVVVVFWRKRQNTRPPQEEQYANQMENAAYESDHPVSIKLQNEIKKPPAEIYESTYDDIDDGTQHVDPISDEYDSTKAVRGIAHLDKTDNVYNRLGELEDTYNHVGPSVTEEQAPTYGYNCGEGPEQNTSDVSHEYFTLESGHGAKLPEIIKPETNGDLLPEQATDEISHEYFTLEPGLGARHH